jgi:hypothetical protein
VSKWASMCSRATGPWVRATARRAGSVIEWSPPIRTGAAPTPTISSVIASTAARIAAAPKDGAGTLPPSTAAIRANTSTPSSGWNDDKNRLASRTRNGAKRAPGR